MHLSLLIIEPSPTAKAGRSLYAHISSLWLSSWRITASIASLIIRTGLTSEPLWLCIPVNPKLAGQTLPIAVSLALEIASLKMDSIPCQRSFALAKSRALVSLSTHFARNAEYKSLCILIPQQICHRLLRVFLTACSQIWHVCDSFVVCVGISKK